MTEVAGIPIAKSVTYLGVVISDDLSFRDEMERTKKALSSLDARLWRSTMGLPGQGYFVWKTYVESTLVHRLIIVNAFTNRHNEELRSIYYRHIKSIFAISTNPSKESLLNLIFGDLNQYLDAKLKLITERFDSQEDLKTMALKVAQPNARLKFLAANRLGFIVRAAIGAFCLLRSGQNNAQQGLCPCG